MWGTAFDDSAYCWRIISLLYSPHTILLSVSLGGYKMTTFCLKTGPLTERLRFTHKPRLAVPHMIQLIRRYDIAASAPVHRRL